MAHHDRLPSETEAAVGRLDPETATVIGGPAAVGGVLLLAHGQDLDHSPTVMDWADERAGTFERLLLLGGPAAIDETTRRVLERAARQRARRPQPRKGEPVSLRHALGLVEEAGAHVVPELDEATIRPPAPWAAASLRPYRGRPMTCRSHWSP